MFQCFPAGMLEINSSTERAQRFHKFSYCSPCSVSGYYITRIFCSITLCVISITTVVFYYNV